MLSDKTLLKLYTDMVRIRTFEEKVAELIDAREIKCPVHLSTGQEAIAVGVCANLKDSDYIFSTHRNHAHYLAKGGDMQALMAELYGKETGCSHGKGGSMHTVDTRVGMMGSSAIVAGTIPIAVGAALAFKLNGSKNVSVAFFGDGATNEGVFYEALNFAGLYRLPIIFVCENNGYTSHLSIRDCLALDTISGKGYSFNIFNKKINGNDVESVYKTVKTAVKYARKEKEPALIECLTYRWHGHVGTSNDLDKGLRSKEEYDAWMLRDPIIHIEDVFVDEYGLRTMNLIEESARKEVEDALAFAKKE